MLDADPFGLPIPDAGPAFTAALIVHIVAGLTAVGAGALAATARKRPGRHPARAASTCGHSAAPATTATVMAAMRWREDAHLFALAVVAVVLCGYGYRTRRLRRRGWPVHHATGMGGSYIVLLTAFYVDNGPFLPLWSRLPHIAYWLLPSAVGVPAIWLAVHRFTRKSALRHVG